MENTMATMTMKAFLSAVIATEGIAPEVAEFASAQLVKIDEKNAKRRTTPTKAQVANADLLAVILSGMTEGQTVTASEVATAQGITTQKASAILSGGVKSGALTATEVKVKGKGKVKGYSLPTEGAGV